MLSPEGDVVNRLLLSKRTDLGLKMFICHKAQKHGDRGSRHQTWSKSL
jgi:hypothetical protein